VDFVAHEAHDVGLRDHHGHFLRATTWTLRRGCGCRCWGRGSPGCSVTSQSGRKGGGNLWLAREQRGESGGHWVLRRRR
jgi:hypothetical protein